MSTLSCKSNKGVTCVLGFTAYQSLLKPFRSLALSVEQVQYCVQVLAVRKRCSHMAQPHTPAGAEPELQDRLLCCPRATRGLWSVGIPRDLLFLAGVISRTPSGTGLPDPFQRLHLKWLESIHIHFKSTWYTISRQIPDLECKCWALSPTNSKNLLDGLPSLNLWFLICKVGMRQDAEYK